MDKIVLYTILILIFAGFGFWAIQSGFLPSLFSDPISPAKLPQGIVLFYGNGCSHCKNVEDFLAQNKIEEKIAFSKLEVWFDKNNASLLGQIATKCGIKGNSVGVPFLYDGEKCIIGDTDIIEFFEEKINIK